MPRGVRKTLSDKLFDLARPVPVDEFVTAVAEMFAFSMKDNNSVKLHEIFGEMNVRAQAFLRDWQDYEAEQKRLTRKKPGPKPGTKYGPRKKKA